MSAKRLLSIGVIAFFAGLTLVVMTKKDPDGSLWSGQTTEGDTGTHVVPECGDGICTETCETCPADCACAYCCTSELKCMQSLSATRPVGSNCFEYGFNDSGGQTTASNACMNFCTGCGNKIVEAGEQCEIDVDCGSSGFSCIDCRCIANASSTPTSSSFSSSLAQSSVPSASSTSSSSPPSSSSSISQETIPPFGCDAMLHLSMTTAGANPKIMEVLPSGDVVWSRSLNGTMAGGALAANGVGQIYALQYINSLTHLVRITASGLQSIGPLSQNLPFGTSNGMSFAQDGKLYMTNDVTEGLYTVDPSTAQVTLVHTFSNMFSGGDLAFEDEDTFLYVNTTGNVYRVEMSNWSTALLGNIPDVHMTSLALYGGTLYAIEALHQKLLRIDLNPFGVSFSNPNTLFSNGDMAGCTPDPTLSSSSSSSSSSGGSQSSVDPCAGGICLPECRNGNTPQFRSKSIRPAYPRKTVLQWIIDSLGGTLPPGFQQTLFNNFIYDGTMPVCTNCSPATYDISSLNIQRDERVFIMGFAPESQPPKPHYTDDRAVFYAWDNIEVAYNNPACTASTPKTEPIELATVPQIYYPTGQVLSAIHSGYWDVCGDYIGHDEYYMVVMNCGAGEVSSASSQSSSSGFTTECPQGSPEVIIDSGLEQGVRYNHQLPDDSYRIEVYSPTGLTDAAYEPYVWRNWPTNDFAWHHGSSFLILKNREPVYQEDANGESRVVSYDETIGTRVFRPPYYENMKYAADAARGADVTMTLRTGDYLKFVVSARNDLPSNAHGSFPQNRSKVIVRICAAITNGSSSASVVSTSSQASSTSNTSSASQSSNVSSTSNTSSASPSSQASSTSSVSQSSTVSVASNASSASTVSNASQGGSSVSSTTLVALSALCGNGFRESDEECDDGNRVNTDGCTNVCSLSVCGDGVLNDDEQCDDGLYNANTPDSCRADCFLPSCGDGIQDTDEVCDDGNRTNTDSCSNACLRGLDEVCASNADCSSALCTNARCMPSNLCGNGQREDREACDDGNDDDNDGCTVDCFFSLDFPCETDEQCISQFCPFGICAARAVCGDGVVQRGEACDQGDANSNTVPNRCRSNCLLASFGDGVVDNGEECDDGNQTDGDGCSREGRSEMIAGSTDIQNTVAANIPSAPAFTLPAALLSPPLAASFVTNQQHAGAPVANPETGPAALVVMLSGASAGFAWMKRRR